MSLSQREIEKMNDNIWARIRKNEIVRDGNAYVLPNKHRLELVENNDVSVASKTFSSRKIVVNRFLESEYENIQKKMNKLEFQKSHAQNQYSSQEGISIKTLIMISVAIVSLSFVYYHLKKWDSNSANGLTNLIQNNYSEYNSLKRMYTESNY